MDVDISKGAINPCNDKDPVKKVLKIIRTVAIDVTTSQGPAFVGIRTCTLVLVRMSFSRSSLPGFEFFLVSTSVTSESQLLLRPVNCLRSRCSIRRDSTRI